MCLTSPVPQRGSWGHGQELALLAGPARLLRRRHRRKTASWAEHLGLVWFYPSAFTGDERDGIVLNGTCFISPLTKLRVVLCVSHTLPTRQKEAPSSSLTCFF